MIPPVVFVYFKRLVRLKTYWISACACSTFATDNCRFLPIIGC